MREGIDKKLLDQGRKGRREERKKELWGETVDLGVIEKELKIKGATVDKSGRKETVRRGIPD